MLQSRNSGYMPEKIVISVWSDYQHQRSASELGNLQFLERQHKGGKNAPFALKQIKSSSSNLTRMAAQCQPCLSPSWPSTTCIQHSFFGRGVSWFQDSALKPHRQHRIDHFAQVWSGPWLLMSFFVEYFVLEEGTRWSKDAPVLQGLNMEQPSFLGSSSNIIRSPKMLFTKLCSSLYPAFS